MTESSAANMMIVNVVFAQCGQNLCKLFNAFTSITYIFKKAIFAVGYPCNKEINGALLQIFCNIK